MWKQNQKTKEPDNAEKAFEYAVFLLSLNLRTVGEMVRKMQQRGYSERVIEKTIDELKSRRYLDDERYGEIFLENLKAYRNFGYYGIKKKMLQKNLPAEIIGRLLQENFPVAEEKKIAERFLKKEGFAVKKKNEDEIQYASFGNAEQNKEKAKMANRLKSRGFRSEIISSLQF